MGYHLGKDGVVMLVSIVVVRDFLTDHFILHAFYVSAVRTEQFLSCTSGKQELGLAARGGIAGFLKKIEFLEFSRQLLAKLCTSFIQLICGWTVFMYHIFNKLE